MKFDNSKILFSRNDVSRNIIFPKCSSEELAEFIGILTGDGYMNYYPYQEKYLIEIAGNSILDKDYLTTDVNEMVNSLFNINPAVRFLKGQNTMNLRIISKGIFNFLMQCGFKNGRKGQIGIPLWIQENEKYMDAFTRGLADTDFSFHWRKNYPIINAGLKSNTLIYLVSSHLLRQGFSVAGPYKEIVKDKRGYNDSIIYRIALNGHKNLENWINNIGFRNDRHLRKISGA